MSEPKYDSNYATYITNAGSAVNTSTPPALGDVLNAVANQRGTLLASVAYAPTTVDTCTVVVSSTGLTSVYFSTGHDQAVTFTAPASGKVLFSMSAFVKGGAAAATSTVFGIVSTTQATSPGTVVGVLGLASLTPTATAADNGQTCYMQQIVTGLTVGTAYTWYGAAMYSGTGTTILAQGTTSQTTVPTGAPYVVTVEAA